MARRRMIDPNFWESEDVSRLSLFARLLFVGMISNADDEGRGRAHPIYLRSTVFPYDDIRTGAVEKALAEIALNTSVVLYEQGGNRYYAFDHWGCWQRVDKPQPSKIPPAPPGEGVSVGEEDAGRRMEREELLALAAEQEKPLSWEEAVRRDSRRDPEEEWTEQRTLEERRGAEAGEKDGPKGKPQETDQQKSESAAGTKEEQKAALPASARQAEEWDGPAENQEDAIAPPEWTQGSTETAGPANREQDMESLFSREKEAVRKDSGTVPEREATGKVYSAGLAEKKRQEEKREIEERMKASAGGSVKKAAQGAEDLADGGRDAPRAEGKATPAGDFGNTSMAALEKEKGRAETAIDRGQAGRNPSLREKEAVRKDSGTVPEGTFRAGAADRESLTIEKMAVRKDAEGTTKGVGTAASIDRGQAGRNPSLREKEAVRMDSSTVLEGTFRAGAADRESLTIEKMAVRKDAEGTTKGVETAAPIDRGQAGRNPSPREKEAVRKDSGTVPEAASDQSRLKEKKKREEKLREAALLGGAVSQSAPEAVFQMPLNDGSLYAIYREDCRRWEELYPAVDVSQELRKMIGWLESHHNRRKTRRGIRAFITGWLAREQDKGHGARQESRRRNERDYSGIVFYDPLSEPEWREG